jgi:hypothetical protein
MCGYVGGRAWTVGNRACREEVHLTAEKYRLRPMVPVYILDKQLSSIQILHDVYNALVANICVFDAHTSVGHSVANIMVSVSLPRACRRALRRV